MKTKANTKRFKEHSVNFHSNVIEINGKVFIFAHPTLVKAAKVCLNQNKQKKFLKQVELTGAISLLLAKEKVQGLVWHLI